MILEALAQLIRSGWICAAAIVIVWIETAIVLKFRPQMARTLVSNALSGSFLLAALGSVLVGAGLAWTALALVGAFAAHLADLAYRLRDNASAFKRSTE